MKVEDKAKGFKFDYDLYPFYNPNMDFFIDKEGIITKVDYRLGYFTIDFNCGECKWNYPLSLIEQSKIEKL